MTITAERSLLTRVCRVEELTPGLGVAAMVAGEQVALFRVGPDEVYAVQNYCPFADAQVLSRGITGTRSGEPTIASPIYKQVFSLRDGRCLATMDAEPVAETGPDLRTIGVHMEDGEVYLQVPAAA